MSQQNKDLIQIAIENNNISIDNYLILFVETGQVD